MQMYFISKNKIEHAKSCLGLDGLNFFLHFCSFISLKPSFSHNDITVAYIAAPETETMYRS